MVVARERLQCGYPQAGPLHCLTLILLILLLQSALLTAPGFGQEVSGTEAHLRDISLAAKAAQERGDYRSAAASYEEILRLRPELAEGWANLGLMHQFMGDYSQADHDFQVALSKDPQLYVPNLFLGLNLLQFHQARDAMRYLKRAQNLNPRDEQAVLGLARAYQALHSVTEANDRFYRATEINARDSDAWYGLGVTYLSLQDSAVLQLRKVNLKSAYARVLVAEGFLQQGRTNDAIGIFNELVKSPSQPPCLLTALGLALLQRGSVSEADTAFQRELKIEPGCLLTRLGLARLAITRGDFAAALLQLHSAWDADSISLARNLRRLWNYLSPEQSEKMEAYLKTRPLPRDDFAQLVASSLESQASDGRPATAASLAGSDVGGAAGLEPETTAQPQDLWAQGHYTACETRLKREKAVPSAARSLLLAQCAYYAGDYRTSLLASEAALKADPQAVPAMYWQAKSAQELATEALTQTSLLAPRSSRVHLLMAELYQERLDFRAAEAEYAKVVDSAPGGQAAHLGLANVYYRLFQDERAQAQLKYVFDADPTNWQAGFLMGEILVRAHQYSEATPYLRLALRGDTLSVPRVHSLLSRCYAAQGQLPQALAELKAALPEDTDGVFHYQLYQLYERMGDHRAAAIALRDSEKLRKQEEGEEELKIQKALDGAATIMLPLDPRR